MKLGIQAGQLLVQMAVAHVEEEAITFNAAVSVCKKGSRWDQA